MEGIPSESDMFMFLFVGIILPTIGIAIVNYIEQVWALRRLKKHNPELYKVLTGKDP